MDWIALIGQHRTDVQVRCGAACVTLKLSPINPHNTFCNLIPLRELIGTGQDWTGQRRAK